jgi:hypothetical protein
LFACHLIGTDFIRLIISYDGQNGVLSSKSIGKDNKFEENFLIICEYFNFVKDMLFSLKYVWNGVGNDLCRSGVGTFNVRITILSIVGDY